MPLVGAQVYWADAWTGKKTYTATWTIEMPPSDVLAKVVHTFYMEYYGQSVGMVGAQFVSFRRRRPDGSDETVFTGRIPVVSESTLTSITYGLFINNCQATILLDLGFWS